MTIMSLEPGRYLCRLVLWCEMEKVHSSSLSYIDIYSDGRVVVYPFVQELQATIFLDGAVILTTQEGWRELNTDNKKDYADPYRAAQSFLRQGILAERGEIGIVAINFAQ